MDIKITYACSEFVQVMRLLLSNRAEWSLDAHAIRVGFARAYDGVLQPAILASMRGLGAPEPPALA